MGCRLAFFAFFIAAASALPSVERVKRADETVMFGNQQNLAHKSVKKSGPAPLGSKMAAKQEAVAAKEEDPENELPKNYLTAADEDQLEEELRTLMKEHQEADKKKAEKKAKKAERPTVELDLAHAEKKAAEPHTKKPVKTRKDFEEDIHYLNYLINKMNPEDAFAGHQGPQLSRQRRAASQFRRIRRSLSKIATEGHMAVSAQHRKKRDTSIDPRQLAMLEYMLAQSNDGYEEPQEVEEPVYDRAVGDEPALTPAGLARERLENAELERLEEEDQQESERPPPEVENDYRLTKRVPDLESNIEEPLQVALDLEDPAAEEEVPEPVSVYKSEYGPLIYSMVEHNGVRGLFVPLEQPSMAQLAVAEDEDRQREKQRLNILGSLLNLNERKK